MVRCSVVCKSGRQCRYTALRDVGMCRVHVRKFKEKRLREVQHV